MARQQPSPTVSSAWALGLSGEVQEVVTTLCDPAKLSAPCSLPYDVDRLFVSSSLHIQGHFSARLALC